MWGNAHNYEAHAFVHTSDIAPHIASQYFGNLTLLSDTGDAGTIRRRATVRLLGPLCPIRFGFTATGR
jgi:hypothetical protein